MSREHEVDDDTEGPAVDALVVWLLQQDLWCHVAKRAERLVTRLARSECLTQAEIDKLDGAIERLIHHQNVFWFQVSMSNTETVEVVNGGSNLMRNLFCSILGDFEILGLEI